MIPKTKTISLFPRFGVSHNSDFLMRKDVPIMRSFIPLSRSRRFERVENLFQQKAFVYEKFMQNANKRIYFNLLLVL